MHFKWFLFTMDIMSNQDKHHLVNFIFCLFFIQQASSSPYATRTIKTTFKCLKKWLWKNLKKIIFAEVWLLN